MQLRPARIYQFAVVSRTFSSPRRAYGNKIDTGVENAFRVPFRKLLTVFPHYQALVKIVRKSLPEVSAGLDLIPQQLIVKRKRRLRSQHVSTDAIKTISLLRISAARDVA